MSEHPVRPRFKNIYIYHQLLLLLLGSKIRPASLAVKTQSKISLMIRYSLERKKGGGI